MTPIGSISRIMLFVKDVPTVAAFYRDVLGLPILGEISPQWVELQAGSCTVALHSASKPLHDRSDASAKIVFGVKDVPAGKALLESRGVTMGKPLPSAASPSATARTPRATSSRFRAVGCEGSGMNFLAAPKVR